MGIEARKQLARGLAYTAGQLTSMADRLIDADDPDPIAEAARDSLSRAVDFLRQYEESLDG